MTDGQYESVRMDWRSMFVYDPNKRLVRLIGAPERRAEYGRVMFERKRRYRAWELACNANQCTELYQELGGES